MKKMLKFKDVISMIVILLMIISSGTTLSLFHSTSVYISFALMAILLCIICNKSLVYSRLNWYKLMFGVVIFLTITLPSQIYNGLYLDYFNLLLRFLFVVFLSMFLSIGTDNSRVIKGIVKWIVYLSIISFVYANVSDFGFSIYSRGDYSVESIGYIINRASTLNFFGIQLYRSQGIFWEPGLLQLYICLHLLNAVNDENKNQLFVSVFALALTFSVTGIIISVFILLVNFKKIQINFIIKIMLLLLVIVGAIYFSYMKIYITGLISSGARNIDLLAAKRIIMDNPFFGIGYGSEKYLSVLYSYVSDLIFNTEVRGTTNSLLYLFSSFGVPAACLYLWMFLKQNIFITNRYSYLLILLVTSAASPVMFMNFYLFIWASCFVKREPLNRARS